MIDDKDIIRREANGNDPYANENLDDYGMLSSLSKVLSFWTYKAQGKIHPSRTETVLGCLFSIFVVSFVGLAAVMTDYMIILMFF